MNPPSIAQDLALKKLSVTPPDQKPNYNWRDILGGEDLPVPEIQVLCPHGEERFDLSEVADTVGRSLSNLLLAKGEKDIFNEKNQRFVADVTREVAQNLTKKALERGPLRVSLHDLYVLIEKTLVDNNAHDVAKSLLLKRASKLNLARETHGVTVRLIRRNHQVVPWNSAKIEIAIRKAFLSLQKDPAPASAITRAVTERAAAVKQAFLHIEEVQDMVQEELMKAGHYKVAEDYILYRAHRQAAREAAPELAPEPTAAPSQPSMVVVARADGTTELWNGLDLKKRIEFASIGLELCLTPDQIEAELRRALFDNIALGDLNNTIILNAKTLIEKDADFAKFAGRIQLSYIYEEVLGWDIVRDGIAALKKFHQQAFAKYIDHGIAIKRLTPRLKEYDLAKIAAALDPSADLEFDFLGVQTVYDRYLIIDKTGKRSKRLETPQFFWMRVAMGLFLDEKKKGREDWAIRLYELYKSRRFCSSTPTLFNSGTLHSQLSSCYLYYVDDSLEGIMYRGIAENAQLSKWAGGLGGSWTSVRGTGAHIAGTNGESQGVIPFLKLHNDQLVAVNQGGKRKGSGCAYLESWHNDIFEFLELRRNTGDDRRRTHDMNTANWIPDLFMKRMEARGTWTLFRANETPDLHHLYGRKFEEAYLKYEKMGEEGKIQAHKIEALELWKKMLSMLFETGHPWITFKDPCNVRSPQDHAGVIHSSNLCTEITLNTSNEETAVCNLGSVILDSHLKPDGSLDHEKLRDTIHVAVRALDNVIDINFYPTVAAKTSNLRHRPIGLGVMGLANSLYMKGIPFASSEAVEFNDEFMEAIAYYAYESSSDLAAERGTYSSYKGSKWDRGLLPPDTVELLAQERGLPIQVPAGGKMDWTPLRQKIAKHGMRNSNVLAIAPTATISNITNTSPCIEPTYKNLYVKSNLSGEFVVLNPFLVKDLKARNLWNQEMIDALKYFDGELKDIEAIPADLKARYLTAFDVDFKWVIDAAARRQKWIDQSQSVNLWLKSPDLKVLSHMYRHAWHAGLKTTYYLRTLGASNIEKATVSVKKEVRGAAGETKAETATRDAKDVATAAALSTAPFGGGSISASTEPQVSGLSSQVSASAKKIYTPAEKTACSIEAMKNGEICEACQ
ncbi:ribonucleoside-diphosphate reductase subunit alpha [Opitutus sp. GAS368]|uniref:ribonucleoside-diphosphate reductase subunit alpha n=1 Tax=Opitutus sp. GAS368 TaxID=1882749 RepID=UPI000879AC7F|nr:ribonucleoside-diphosphate reductase subunit alpha [Opitutus sp. GAS368]SDR73305.1 ribonucleoside-diphosphate reductase alpha chain [Opitutus sp. GAS368]